MKVAPTSSSFYRLSNPPFVVVDWLRYGVPLEHRYYDKDEDDGNWYIHEDYLISAIELAYKRSWVDYSELSDYIQMQVAKEKENWRVSQKAKYIRPSSSTILRDAYTRLHLLPSAPSNVIHAAWHALAKVYHPDRGGDSEEFRKYSEAYETIKKEIE